MCATITRRDLLRAAAGIPAAAAVNTLAAAGRAPRKLADAGWCWDGQGFNGGVNPSIFGAGEGTRWFGLDRVCHMFHANNALAMEKLRGFSGIVCEISKWKIRRCENGVAHYHDGSIATKCEEAAKVSALGHAYSNVKGAIDDDLLGIIKREKIKPEQYAAVREALRRQQPGLELWTVVYTKELKPESWAGFQPHLDVVSLWEWDAADLPNLPRYLDQCRKIFPDKPINVGCYLRDFVRRQGVALDMLKVQWELVRQWVADGTIQGYSILGGFLIDMHPEQAAWVRDFIKAH